MIEVLTYWNLDLSSLILFLIIVFFIVAIKAYLNKKTFISAISLLIICLFSPLHILSSHYLFSAHMIVHVILLLLIGPLLLASLSAEHKRFGHIFSFLKCYPIAGWLSGIGLMWFWHIPAIFNSAMSSMNYLSFNIMSIIEALSLIVAGALFSAPVLHPNKDYRVDVMSGVVYLFTACIGCSLLGLLITFAPAETYHHFLSMHDLYGLNRIILQNGITQIIDQQAAGLIMWVPCCLIYVTGAMYLLIQWFNHKEETSNLIKQI
jgi:putative membrane protein